MKSSGELSFRRKDCYGSIGSKRDGTDKWIIMMYNQFYICQTKLYGSRDLIGRSDLGLDSYFMARTNPEWNAAIWLAGRIWDLSVVRLGRKRNGCVSRVGMMWIEYWILIGRFSLGFVTSGLKGWGHLLSCQSGLQAASNLWPRMI